MSGGYRNYNSITFVDVSSVWFWHSRRGTCDLVCDGDYRSDLMYDLCVSGQKCKLFQ